MDFQHFSPNSRNLSRQEYVTSWIKGKATIQSGNEFNLPTCEEVLTALKSNPELLNYIVQKDVNVSKCHDMVILEQIKSEYEVYWTDRGKKIETQHFVDVWEAVSEYLKSWGLKKK